MRLRAWSSVHLDVELDPETGRGRRVPRASPRPDSDPILGFAAVERSPFGRPQIFAVYRSGDAVLFQAGRRRWRLGEPGLAFAHERLSPFLSAFRVLEHEVEVFSFRYFHVGRLLMAWIDPTYDRLDEETDFFLDFVAENACSPTWLRAIRERWHPA